MTRPDSSKRLERLWMVEVTEGTYNRPDVAVIYPQGKSRETLVEALQPRSVRLFETVAELSIGQGARLYLVSDAQVESARTLLGTKVSIIALLDQVDTAGPSLQAGADEVIVWPSAPVLLRKRVTTFLDGIIGPGRLVLDTTRVTSLAHALRNPLNVITLYAELLRMESLSPDAIGSVGRLVRAAKRVDALVSELETLLYLEAQEAPIRCQPTELGELVDIVLAELRYDIEDKPLEVFCSKAQDGTLALADPNLSTKVIHAVFGRVTKLALGGAQVSVRVLNSPPVIEFEAPIPPIPAHAMSSFHTPATELDVRESMGGVGVGLSFAHKAMTSMRGRMEHTQTSDGRAVTRLIFEPYH